MKSSAILLELDHAHVNTAKIDSALLNHFIATGSYEVRQRIVDLLSNRSTATSSLKEAELLDFLLKMVHESYGKIDGVGYTDNVVFFLSCVRIAKIDDDLRSCYVQRFLDFVDEIVSPDPEKNRGIGNVLIDRLDRIIPNVEEDKRYIISPNVRELIKDRLPANNRPWVPGLP